MNHEYETTRDAYAHLEHTETSHRLAVEALADFDPEVDDQAELIRDLFGCRDRAHLARVEAARATGFLSLACEDHGATLSDVVNRFSRRLIMSAPPKPTTPESWGPEEGMRG
ncbi:hypothetical protein KGD82_16500 [Nocardiopsis eucommiae]|uniref:Uncharacterized protein n=1 Tax=Nocardiopsis eucommiae TaxID=2831970 RepID=A0A975L782_9ACTN|nr:hypothetical protein KGD82_16500 [Nocardiopsis eucommiae]